MNDLWDYADSQYEERKVARSIDQVAYLARRLACQRWPEEYRMQVIGSDLWEDIPADLGQHLWKMATWSNETHDLVRYSRKPQRPGDERDRNWYVIRVKHVDEAFQEYEEYLATVRASSIYEGV